MGPALARGLLRPSARCPRLYNHNYKWNIYSPLLLPQARLYAAVAASITHPLAENANSTPDRSVITPRTLFRLVGQANDPAVHSTSSFLASLTSEVPMFERLRKSSSPFDTLRHEADVCNRLGSATSLDSRQPRLVDDSLHSQNMNIWLEILRFRLRIDGQDGVMDVIDAMDQRFLKLPMDGPVADSIWSIFLSTAGSNPPSLLRLYTYASETLPSSDLCRINLYSRIIGPLLRHNPKFVQIWHNRMQRDNILPNDPASTLAQFIEYACTSVHQSRAIESFKHVYRRLDHAGLYDDCMSRACALIDFHVALDLHSFFIREGHHPSPELSSTPIVAHLISCAWLAKSNIRKAKEFDRRTRKRMIVNLSAKKLMTNEQYTDEVWDAQHNFQRLQPSSSKPSEHSDSWSMPTLTRENMNTIVGDVHGIREKELGDAFCARLFATTAFSTDLIISGLRMLGLESIGPLALREIAARVQAPSDYSVTVDALKATGISVPDSIFHRALLSFAADPEKRESFYFLVTSDQHPTAYQDQGQQEQMYAAFLSAGKATEANATLDILTLDNPNPDHFHANLLLKIYVRRAEREPIVQILQQMRLQRIPVSESAIKRLHSACLRTRARSKRPIAGREDKYGDDLNFTANVYLETMRSGNYLSPWRWREILKRYGMTNRLESLEQLCLWLVTCYSGRIGQIAMPVLSTPAQSQYPPISSENSGLRHPYSIIFTDKFLSALIAWGFKSEAVPTASVIADELPVSLPGRRNARKRKVTPEKWAWGIAIVRQLNRLGVGVVHKELRRAVKLRLWMLYGPGKSDLPSNRTRLRQNNIPLVHRVMHIDAIWGGNFFALPQRLRKGRLVSDADMYHALFVRQPMRASKRRPASAQVEPRTSCLY